MLVAVAVIFLGGALYLYLVWISAAPPLAALIVGLTALILAGLIIVVARMASRCSWASRAGDRSGQPDSSAAGNISDLASQLGGLAARELTAQTKAHPYRAVAVALIAGLAIGGSPELRDMLKKMTKS
jgi:hypothetical protein